MMTKNTEGGSWEGKKKKEQLTIPNLSSADTDTPVHEKKQSYGLDNTVSAVVHLKLRTERNTYRMWSEVKDNLSQQVL